MRQDELHILLLEYVEGTIAHDKKLLLEEQLKTSSVLRAELQLLQETYTALNGVEDEQASPLYFSNFLPRLRERIEQRKTNAFNGVVLWMRRVMPAALAGAALIVIGIGSYYLLMPDSRQQSLYELVNKMDEKDIDDLLDYYADDVVEDALHESDFTQKNLITEALALNSLDENIVNDGQIIFNLTDDEIEMIVKRLNAHTVQ